MAQEDHFDQDSLEMLKDVMADEFGDLILVYIKDSDDRLPLIHDALAAADATQLRELAHSFKGASANISAAPLAELCFRLESAARDGHLADADVLVAAIESEYQQVAALLKGML